jgi:hypothetical protein
MSYFFVLFKPCKMLETMHVFLLPHTLYNTTVFEANFKTFVLLVTVITVFIIIPISYFHLYTVKHA